MACGSGWGDAGGSTAAGRGAGTNSTPEGVTLGRVAGAAEMMNNSYFTFHKTNTNYICPD